MDEIIKLVTEKVGIPTDKAKLAVDTVLGFVKSKVPGPIAGQIDSAIAGTTGGVAGTVKGFAEKLVGTKV